MIYWLIGLVIAAIAGWGLYRSFRNPKFVARLTAYVGSEAFKALLPSLEKLVARKSPEEEAKDDKAYSEGEQRATPFNRHPGEH